MTANALNISQLRMLDIFKDSAKSLARFEIRRERQACRIIAAYDEIPKGWIDWPKNFDPVGEDVCVPCAKMIIRHQQRAGVELADVKTISIDYDSEVESSRNCASCGRPLISCFLRYGMESEWEHFASDFFRDDAIASGVSANQWYWLWRILEETTSCDQYFAEFGSIAECVVLWLRDNGFYRVKPGMPLKERVKYSALRT